MSTRHGRCLLTALWAALFLGCPCAGRAQEWARKMFDHLSHDFGVVARGAKVEHVFTVENIYEEDAHIASVSSTCGCTVPEVNKTFLKTWEKAQIKAVVDTRKYTGRRDATLKIVLDKPFPAEVQVQIYCFIRGDVVLKPEVVQFGNVAAGKEWQREISVVYGIGRPDWKIERVESANPHLVAQAVEQQRTPGEVHYQLRVTLKGTAPPGYVRDQLFLVTNDYAAQTARVPVPVEGIVVSGLTARPSPLMLGLVEAGETTAARTLVVQGASPFTILAVRCADARFSGVVPEGSKAVHMVPITFKAGSSAEKVGATLLIETDQASPALQVPVHVQVTPKAGTGNPP